MQGQSLFVFDCECECEWGTIQFDYYNIHKLYTNWLIVKRKREKDERETLDNKSGFFFYFFFVE